LSGGNERWINNCELTIFERGHAFKGNLEDVSIREASRVVED
jgi:hypothetical protein